MTFDVNVWYELISHIFNPIWKSPIRYDPSIRYLEPCSGEFFSPLLELLQPTLDPSPHTPHPPTTHKPTLVQVTAKSLNLPLLMTESKHLFTLEEMKLKFSRFHLNQKNSTIQITKHLTCMQSFQFLSWTQKNPVTHFIKEIVGTRNSSKQVKPISAKNIEQPNTLIEWIVP